MNPQERDAILAEYEAMEKEPPFTPWQVAVSEALRDGDAARAIEAWRLRNRLHLCHDEEKTIARLVDDWIRYRYGGGWHTCRNRSCRECCAWNA